MRDLTETLFSHSVGVPFQEGPTVVRKDDGMEFKVSFPKGSRATFKDARKIIHDRAKTAGEAQRLFLHDALDAYLDREEIS